MLLDLDFALPDRRLAATTASVLAHCARDPTTCESPCITRLPAGYRESTVVSALARLESTAGSRGASASSAYTGPVYVVTLEHIDNHSCSLMRDFMRFCQKGFIGLPDNLW